MESYWLQSLESSLRKETHPDVIRTVHIVPHNETWDEFMSRHLVELENNGIGKFSSMKKRGADHIQWRCERANKCKGKSSGDPTTTRANGCGAYVSFTFVSKNTFNSCIVRLMNKHSGHDLNNPEEGRSNRINSNLIAFIHSCFQLGDSNAEILLKCKEWAKAQGKMDLRDRQYFVTLKDLRMLKKSFHAQTRVDGNDGVGVDHLVKTEAVEVCLQSFLPESLSNTNPSALLQQPIESNTASANDAPFSLPTNHLEIASFKVPRRMKRKRTTGPNHQGDSFDPPEQTASPSTSTQQQPPPNISTNNPYSSPTPTFPSTSQFSSYNHSSKPVPLTTFLQSPLSLTPFPSTSNTHATLVQIHPTNFTTTATNTTTTITATNTTTDNTTTTTTTTTSSSTTTTIPSHTALHPPSILHSPTPVSPPSSSTQDIPPPVNPASFSTQHTPTAAAPAPSTPKIFKEICSILPLSSGGKKRRCKITVEELERRVGPPEYMSFSSLAAYLKTDNNARKELQVQLEEAGIKPTQLTAETSLFSRLCEEEVDALCESLAGLVRDHLPFQGLHVIPEAEDELATVGRLLEFRSHLRRAIAAIKDRVEAVDLASHGFMSKMLDIILSMFEKCLANQMSSRAGQDIDIISIS